MSGPAGGRFRAATVEGERFLAPVQETARRPSSLQRFEAPPVHNRAAPNDVAADAFSAAPAPTEGQRKRAASTASGDAPPAYSPPVAQPQLAQPQLAQLRVAAVPSSSASASLVGEAAKNLLKALHALRPTLQKADTDLAQQVFAAANTVTVEATLAARSGDAKHAKAANAGLDRLDACLVVVDVTGALDDADVAHVRALADQARAAIDAS